MSVLVIIVLLIFHKSVRCSNYILPLTNYEIIIFIPVFIMVYLYFDQNLAKCFNNCKFCIVDFMIIIIVQTIFSQKNTMIMGYF